MSWFDNRRLGYEKSSVLRLRATGVPRRGRTGRRFWLAFMPVLVYGSSMKVILNASADAPWQQLSHEWYGQQLVPGYEFRFSLTADALVFAARRAAPALLHPEARCGAFRENLWKYDTAEFFLATMEGDRYMEFNLAPNGAWWAAAFTGPRVVNEAVPAVPQGVCATGQATAAGWECEARLPLDWLALMGIEPGKAPCRVAAAAILESPQQLFLTTATDLSGVPDFHRPLAWEEAALAD